MEININDYEKVVKQLRERKRTRKTRRTANSGRRIYALVVMTVGLLCVLQATLNISLRLFSSERDLTAERDQLQRERDQLETGFNNLVAERDHLMKEIERLNETNSEGCPHEWRKFGCHCYYASTGKKPWEESRRDCLARAAYLVVIDSREEQTFINGLYASGLHVWIGLTDRDSEGNWTWVDGTPLTTAYWQKGQPNSYKTEQDCVEFFHRALGQLGEWNDEACSAENQRICEK
ncbi:CD209 antigen-like protein C [Hypomesus transpacificus]|uniref:CD209 antigen-like protein C n=1 Tax=Hypomesus transpacificus TaxID=137520 RepID=UPI001F078806|nr:CD209 antigen-like protein C [Hypomesus transpacificus]